MVGVEVRPYSAVSGSVHPSKELHSASSHCTDQQMQTEDLADDKWSEDASGFGIPDGTLQLVGVPRRRWRRPMELPLPPPSPAEAPILQEFSRPWRALCLPLPPTSGEQPKAGAMNLLHCIIA
ncbi:unnamed protein product [Phytophthora fragariaefolia]|uniref:Unnamed protein product n=1 Tax=Phytophthora fragariaefolia TaxID=1490495 RepID=A0A9W6XJ35_9STRA|nr:unnamed protein product [Phytophthora fragariaefolia]